MRGLWIASLLLGCTLPAPASEGVDQWVRFDTDHDRTWSWGDELTIHQADASLIGEPAEDSHSLVSPVGDVNGDGIDDVTVASVVFGNYKTFYGRVHLVYGRPDGWAPDASLSGTSSIVGTAEDPINGWAVGVGDVNGDGLADVGIGSTNWLDECLMLGSPDPWPVELPVDQVDVVAHDDAAASGKAGNPVRQTTSVGDVDGDGLDDWLLIRDYTNGGEAWVLSGAALSDDVPFPGDAVALSVQGAAFKSLGDVTGDGLSDLGGTAGGRLFVVPGASTPPKELDLSAASSAEFDGEIYYVSPIGDLDQDGIDDLAIYSTVEGVPVFFGGSRIDGVLTLDQRDVLLAPGFRAPEIEPIGDIDGDGLPELALLAADASKQTDIYDIVVYFGRTEWPSELGIDEADIRIRGTSGAEELRLMSHTIGDIDGDGMDELFLSAHYESWAGVSEAGTVRIFRGRADWPPEIDRDDYDLLVGGSFPYQNLGEDTNFVVTDINGDGADDMLTSTEWYDDAGATFLFFGHPAP
jgi:hypothetical protein